ncbi:pyridoxal phosphate-dependent aminotransferase [Streptomyces sp. NPDC020681]|uniref:pyridoxal phosphate-dependent aminotransferase n=1 Tax=Streptomyces sp. NPDC020681 TaxID=3365083 RepID=UPI0037ABE609
MPIPFREVISHPDLPARFPDAEMIERYLGAGSPAGELIYLGLGETWTQVAPGLVSALAGPLPSHSHGYIVSQYGLPRLQRTLRSYIASSHRLPSGLEAGRDFEVAVTSGGTRNAMFDFARLLQSEPSLGLIAESGVTPVLISTLPGWSYESVVDALGYRSRYLPLWQDNGYQPSTKEFDELLDSVIADPGQKPAIIAINAQHNPTGVNWRPDTVRHMIRRALEAGAAVLIDDAYYGVHDPGVTPTSALRILLEELQGAPPEAHRRWLAVRSLGKQFHCSGWGIGAATAHPDTLDALVNTVLLTRSFATAVPLQEAMADWLEDPAAERYREEKNQEFAAKRAEVSELVRTRLGYPPDAIHVGDCTAFLCVRLPFPAHRGGEHLAEFLEECLNKTGVLMGVDRTIADRSGEGAHEPICFRIYLGPPQEVLTEAVTRLATAGYTYRL